MGDTSGQCVVDGCDKPARARKLCRACYDRFQRDLDRHNARVAAGLPSVPPEAPPPQSVRPDSLAWLEWDRLDVALAVSEADMVAADWLPRARCALPEHAGVDMFPEDSGGVGPAKAVCERCPVVYDCLAYALRTDTDHGVFGRTSQRERTRIRQALQAARRSRTRPRLLMVTAS